jgi:hypothetical protein
VFLAVLLDGGEAGLGDREIATDPAAIGVFDITKAGLTAVKPRRHEPLFLEAPQRDEDRRL